jgi:hypothetical protein
MPLLVNKIPNNIVQAAYAYLGGACQPQLRLPLIFAVVSPAWLWLWRVFALRPRRPLRRRAGPGIDLGYYQQGTRKRRPAPRFSCLNRVFYLGPLFCEKNGLFFRSGEMALRVEKKNTRKSTRATPGARAQAPPPPPARPAPRPESHGPHVAEVAS